MTISFSLNFTSCGFRCRIFTTIGSTSPDDEREGKWSVNFSTSPQGDIDKATMSLDEAEATFVRRAPKLDPAMAQRLAGTYETPNGFTFQVALRPNGQLYLVSTGSPDEKLTPYKGLRFRVQEFADSLV